MNTEAIEILTLLEQKKDIIFQILRMANDTDFNEANTENAEKFVRFIDDRGKLIEKLKIINSEIESIKAEVSFCEKLNSIQREINTMTNQIARVESNNKRKIQNIMSHVQKEIKDINIRKRVSRMYESKL